jgi:hypothetical protein
MKTILRSHPKSRFGVLLCQGKGEEDSEERFGRLAQAVTKFLGRKLKGYGHLSHELQLYQSLLHGQLLYHNPHSNANVQVLAKMARRLMEESVKEAPLHELLRRPEQDSLIEVLSTPTISDSRVLSSVSLSREEESYFDRASVS